MSAFFAIADGTEEFIDIVFQISFLAVAVDFYVQLPGWSLCSWLKCPTHCWVKSFWGAKVQSVFSSLPPLVYSPFHRRGLYQGLALSDKTEFSTLHFQSLSIQSRDLVYCWKHAFLWGSFLTNPSCYQYDNEDVSDKAENTKFNSFHHHSLCLPSFIMAKYEIGSKSFPHRKLLKLQFIEFWPNSYTES